MVFSSPIFVFLYLPVVLLAFVVLPRVARTPMLVVASLAFYAWGEKRLVGLLIASIVFNWLLGLAVERAGDPRVRRALVIAAVALNIGALVSFKYTNFIVGNLDELLAHVGRKPLDVAPVHLPIGISFITFEALSYVIDVYRRDTRAARNPFHVALYVSFFPHLIAGPILRFSDIAPSVARPAAGLAELDGGIRRFVEGLAKKMLLANPLGHTADQVFALAASDLGTPVAWLGIVCYALQIYFDFSGYSDMAIGLGHMFGFTLPENFRLPYAATSIKDFWRRWHISLSSWFRDYLFIPLGGSRRGTARTYVNLFTVFLLCGLWHGASWSFVVWGAFHGGFLVLERTGFGRIVDAAPRPLRHAYTMLVVLVGWVFFRADSLGHAGQYLRALVGATTAIGPRLVDYVGVEVLLALVAAAIWSVVDWTALWERCPQPLRERAARVLALPAVPLQLALLVLSLLYVAAGTYNPFIYFRF